MNADIRDLIERSAARLQRDDLTAAQARAVAVECGEAESLVAQRIAAIAPRNEIRAAGPERARVLATGSEAELRALDDEHARLTVQAERLIALRDRASALRQALAAREASEALPGQFEALGEALARLEAARKAVAAAEQVAHALRGVIAQGRGTALAGGHPAPVAPVALVRRLIELHPAAARHPEHAADQLGVRLGDLRPEAA